MRNAKQQQQTDKNNNNLCLSGKIFQHPLSKREIVKSQESVSDVGILVGNGSNICS